MPVREHDTWYRIELFGRGGWKPAPSPVDPELCDDFDTESDALAYGRGRYLMRNEHAGFRSPVWGQWRVQRVKGLRD